MRAVVVQMLAGVVAATWIAGTVQAQAPAPSPAASTEESQERPDDQPLRLTETVEVTATRGAVDTIRSPASSTVVTRADIERRNAVTVDQALGEIEGVAVYRTRGLPDNGVGIGMRGFSGRSSGQARVLVLLDGQPINDPYLGSVNWTALPVDEVDRVEVVRGPFSALYGGNAMGGVVNVLTRPVDRRSLEISGQYGTHETGSLASRFSERFFGRLGVTFAYSHLRTGGYPAQVVVRTATNSTATGGMPVTGVERLATATGGVTYAVGVRGNNFYRQHDVRARVEHSFSSQTIGSLQYIRQATRTGWGAYQSTLRSTTGATVDSGDAIFLEGNAWRRLTVLPSQFLGAEQGGSSNAYQAQFLHATARHGHVRIQGGVFDTPLGWTSLPAAAATLEGGPGTLTHQMTRGIFANAQWSANLGMRHALSVGADTRRDAANITEWPIPDFRNAGPGSIRNTYSNGKAFSQGVYAQDQITLAESFHVTVGGRSDYWRSFDGTTQSSPTSGTSMFANRSTAAVTGKVAGVYAPLPGTALRGSVGTAFRQPSVFELYRNLLDVGTFLFGNPLLEPERLLAWETGVRQRVGRATVDATYYRNRITNLIYRGTDLEFDPTGATRRMFNAGEGKTRGFELGSSVRPAAWLTTRLTYTFTDATITRNPTVPATVGKQIPFVPRHAASASLTAARERAGATLSVRYQSDVFANDTNTDTVSGVPGSYEEIIQADVAANVSLTKRLSLQFTCENLFDRQLYLFYRNPGRVVMTGLRLRY